MRFVTMMSIALFVLLSDTFAQAAQPAGPPAGPLSAPGIQFLALLSAGDIVETPDGQEPLVFIDVPGMTATFDTSTTGCVTATFSAQVYPDFLLRALLDGSLMEGHNTAGIFGLDAIEIRSPQTPGYFSYTFWKCGVDTGPHEIRIQWATFPGNTVQIWGRTLTVLGR